MSNTVLVLSELLIGAFLIYILWKLSVDDNDTEYINAEIKKDQKEKRKPWTRDEFQLLSFYVLYAKGSTNNDLDVVGSLVEILGRTNLSVLKKISIFNNIEKTTDIHKLEREVYFNQKEIGKVESDKLVSIAIENIINLKGCDDQ